MLLSIKQPEADSELSGLGPGGVGGPGGSSHCKWQERPVPVANTLAEGNSFRRGVLRVSVSILMNCNELESHFIQLDEHSNGTEACHGQGGIACLASPLAIQPTSSSNIKACWTRSLLGCWIARAKRGRRWRRGRTRHASPGRAPPENAQ